MGKATIIEAQNSQTVYEEGKSNNGILGKLKGIFADYKNGTRNSDRLYTEELWDNRVFGSEDVMEALETKTLSPLSLLLATLSILVPKTELLGVVTFTESTNFQRKLGIVLLILVVNSESP